MGDNTAIEDIGLEKLAEDEIRGEIFKIVHRNNNVAEATDLLYKYFSHLIAGYRAKEAVNFHQVVCNGHEWVDVIYTATGANPVTKQMCRLCGFPKPQHELDLDLIAEFGFPELHDNPVKQEAELSGQQGKEGGVWVKASEELPEKRKRINGRLNGVPAIVENSNLIEGYMSANNHLARIVDVEWLKPLIIEQGNSEEIERLKLIIKELQYEYMAVQVEPGFRKDDLIDSLQKENELLKEEIKKYQS